MPATYGKGRLATAEESAMIASVLTGPDSDGSSSGRSAIASSSSAVLIQKGDLREIARRVNAQPSQRRHLRTNEAPQPRDAPRQAGDLTNPCALPDRPACTSWPSGPGEGDGPGAPPLRARPASGRGLSPERVYPAAALDSILSLASLKSPPSWVE